ncbi:MAG: S49 family peptidase [Pseudomonadota bacterium]
MFEQLFWAIEPNALAQLFDRLTAYQEQGQAQAGVLGDDNAQPEHGYTVEHGVALLPIDKPLVHGSVRHSWESFFSLGYDDIRADLRAAMADPHVRRVMLVMSSNGGSAVGCKELGDTIAMMAATKPICAFVNGFCFSAAYWLASATGQIFATETAMVGSIGVVIRHVDRSAFNEQIGYKITYLTSGKWKAVGNPDTPLDDESAAHIRAQAVTLHELFRADVAKNMGLSLDDAEKWGDAQTFLGSKAKELGLVSELVNDISEALKNFSHGGYMTFEEFKAQHPELFAQVQSEAKKEALLEGKNHALALVKAALGDDAHAKIAGLVANNVTPEQFAAMAPFMQTTQIAPAGQTPPIGAAGAAGGADGSLPSPSAPSAPASHAQILNAVINATPQPLNVSATAKAPTAEQQDEIDTKAAIARMAQGA